MPAYVEIRTAQVQRYLQRCPTLPYQRGASTLVAAVLDAELDGFLATLPASLVPTRCDEVGRRVSGRALLQVADETAAAELARRVLAWAHTRTPGMHLEAVVGSGPTALAARFTTMRDRLARGELIAAPPATGEVPLLPRCWECGVFPADAGRHRHDPKQHVCRDCQARDRAAGYRRNAGRDALPLLEVELLAALPDAGAAPEDFGALARLAPPNDLRRNHLATISADVNSLGRLCAGLAAAGQPQLLAQVTSAVSTALRQALEAAAGAVQQRHVHRSGAGAPMAVVPHWCGGDDLLVSVAAPDGWAFALALLDAFARHVVADLGDLTLDAAGPPTLSAALVFSHATLPRMHVLEAAEGALEQAKRCSARRRRGGDDGAVELGSGCTVSWTDLTQTSHYRAPADDADSFAVAELQPYAPTRQLLDLLAELPAEMRRRLAGAEAAVLVDELRRGGLPQLAAKVPTRTTTQQLQRALPVVHRWWRS